MPVPENPPAAPEGPKTGASPWVGSNGFPAHPDAPVGGGGPGFFSSGVLGLSGNDGSILAHPDSAVGSEHRLRQEDIDKLDQSGVALDTNVKVTETKVKRNAPPKTATGTTTNSLRNTGLEEVVITVVVLADGVLANNDDGAALSVTATNRDVVFCTMDMDKPTIKKGAEDVPDPEAKVTKITGKMKFRPTVTLQIQYGKNVKPEDPSAYGRGTTDADVKSLDTTLGFHESCHLADSVAYYKDVKNLPGMFTGKVGDKATDFQAKQQAWADAFTDYFIKDGTLSQGKTDNVGRTLDDGTQTTLDEYKKKHSGYKHGPMVS